MSGVPSASFWEVEVRRLSRTLNLGWFASYARRALVGFALVLGLLNLLFKVTWPEMRFQALGLSAVLLLAISAWICYRLAKKHFITSDQARVRLEHSLRLNSSLSALQEGVGANYPETPPAYRLPVTWQWRGIATSLMISVALLVFSEKWPVRALEVQEVYQVEKPQAVRDLEATLEQLREQDALAEESLSEMEQKVQDLLKSKPAEEWFKNSTMEAAEHLREQLQQDLAMLHQQLDNTSQTLEAAQQQNPSAGESSKPSPQSMLEALQQLQKQGLKPGENLSELAKQAAEQLGNMTPEQQSALQEALQKNQQALQEALDTPPQEGKGDPIYHEGEGKGKGEGEQNADGQGPGEGGVSRGPGEAPMVLKKDSSETDASGMGAVESRLDLKRAALGDAIQERVVEHQKLDPAVENALQHGGGARDSSRGASAPMSPSLMPKEKAFLREVLK